MKTKSLFALLALVTCVAGFSSLANAEAVPARTKRSVAQFVEPPPLAPAIVEMMKTNTVGAVESRIYFVESWKVAPVQKAQVFFAMLTNSSPDEQRKLAHAAVKQVADLNYGLLLRCFRNSQLPKPVLSVFMTDTLKRHNSVKMPALLTLAQTDTHPMQAEAMELLGVYLGGNHGTNWMKWEETMLAWLEHNPK